jgi:HD superfamily phosphohydrolase YqeK
MSCSRDDLVTSARDESQPAATAPLDLPAWAVVSDKRRAHIGRVVALIDEWAPAMRLSAEEARAWHDAALLHDVLHDAPEAVLRALGGDSESEVKLIHGPATAVRLAQEGETRRTVLDAIRWHTVGSPDWDRTGRALYMADFLEPGREFEQRDRAYLARQVPRDFDGTFRQVVRMRLEWTLREGKGIFPQTVALWNSVR